METSDIVTLDCWMLRGPHYHNEYCRPHWRRVRILRKSFLRHWAAVFEGTSAPEFNVELYHCACGTQFARRGPRCRSDSEPRCNACAIRRQTEVRRRSSQRQRLRRQEARVNVLARQCSWCGGAMQSQRRTKQYCSVACRVAAARKSLEQQTAALDANGGHARVPGAWARTIRGP